MAELAERLHKNLRRFIEDPTPERLRAARQLLSTADELEEQRQETNKTDGSADSSRHDEGVSGH
jgi:hypothetical protein